MLSIKFWQYVERSPTKTFSPHIWYSRQLSRILITFFPSAFANSAGQLRTIYVLFTFQLPRTCNWWRFEHLDAKGIFEHHFYNIIEISSQHHSLFILESKIFLSCNLCHSQHFPVSIPQICSSLYRSIWICATFCSLYYHFQVIQHLSAHLVTVHLNNQCLSARIG